jgi:Zn-dependent protease with chaperone function
MSDSFAATYYDGRTGRRYAVQLRRVGASHYAIEGDGVRRGGSIALLSITPPLARVERTIELPDGARVRVAHDAAIGAWFPRADRLESLVDRLEKFAPAIAVAIVVSLATLVGGAIWGVPWIADRIAAHVPSSVEHRLGEEVMASLGRFGLKPTNLDAERRAELSTRFDAIARGEGDGLRVEFRHAPNIGANAFAVPGGTVVVTDELVDGLTDDREFDAVVAHEIGHEHSRHALRQTLRGSLVAIAAAVFAGDVSSAAAVVVAVPTFLLDSHYSREFEAEADGFAFDLLARHHESPHWFAEAMRTLQAEASEDDTRVAYLSSHPATIARIEAADAAAIAFAKSHPKLCPNGVCPGEGDDEDEGDDADDADDDD